MPRTSEKTKIVKLFEIIAEGEILACELATKEDLMAGAVVKQLARKYGAVIFFPTFTVTSIYADWSHTRVWKQQQNLKTKTQELH